MLYDIAKANDLTEGRDWSDGERGWMEAVGYGLPGGLITWQIKQNGRVVANIEAQDYALWRCVKEAPEGLILEFGVRAGVSLRKIADSARERPVFGFDWWRGLPHSHGGFTKGDCFAAKPCDLPSNVELVDGLFSDTLEDFLHVHPGPVGFCNLDCDLYASSYYVLRCLASRFVVGSILSLSDVCLAPAAQRQAWLRYLNETWQLWEFLGKSDPWGEVYRCVDCTPRKTYKLTDAKVVPA